MGIFNGLVDGYRKRQGAAVLTAMLAVQVRAGLFDQDPAQTSDILVESAWRERPELFNGGFGCRPQRFAVAAAGLVQGISFFKDQAHPRRDVFVLCLGVLLSELPLHAKRPFNRVDQILFEIAEEVFRAEHARVPSPLLASIDGMLGPLAA